MVGVVPLIPFTYTGVPRRIVEPELLKTVYFIEMVAVMAVAMIGTFAKVFYLQRDGYGLKRPLLSILVDKYYDYLLPLIFGCTSVLLVGLEIGSGLGLAIFTVFTLLAFIPARKTVWLLSPRLLPKKLNAFFIKNKWTIRDYLAKIHDALNLFSVHLFIVFGLKD